MAGEEVCQVCGEPHTKARPRDLTFVLESYERDLQSIIGVNVYLYHGEVDETLVPELGVVRGTDPDFL